MIIIIIVVIVVIVIEDFDSAYYKKKNTGATIKIKSKTISIKHIWIARLK